ncbi:Rab3 GTPase-activating protein catalytic subunit [Mortierella claussenii]|nr:Rab3 GTPase-activating protein catalytic subunit [Mortierella claussenii]
MDDFENFEFIDYTTSGPWERFITQIEDSLRSWGLVDNKLGVFDPAVIAASERAAAESAELTDSHVTADVHRVPERHHDGSSRDARADAHTYSSDSKPASTSPIYQLREMLSLDDATYALSYHYHPAKARAAAGVERIDQEFLPIKLEGFQHHSLHRWTSLTHILIISPVTISDIFASTISPSSATSAIIDLSSAKLLLSSFAIAFQNTGCNVPVFVPTGQPWNLTFTGLMIQPQSVSLATAPEVAPTSSPLASENWSDAGSEEDGGREGTEVRFNTVLVPYPPVQYSHLSGILNFFIERMGIDEHDSVDTLDRHSSHIRDHIYTSALFCYDLVNWHDEDWRRWRQNSDATKGDSRRIEGEAESVFKADAGPTMITPDASMNMDAIRTEGKTLSTLPIPVLPFGPVQDPLQSMRLSAKFACAASSVYLDSKNMADMDASHAHIWILRAAFKEDDYGIISGILEDAISSWSAEAVGSGRKEHKSDNDQTYGALLNKGARLIQGTISMVDAVDVENIVDALLDPVPAPAKQSPILGTNEQSDGGHHNIRLIPASELGLQFRHAMTVPYDSFLWRMIQYLLDVISPSSDISYPTTVMGFMKVLWSELLKQFYLRWENSQLIPLVDIFGEGYDNYGMHSALESDQKIDSNLEKKPVAIDLRYNMLHQKLSMLNCCIARQIARNKELPGEVHPVLKRPRNKSKEYATDEALAFGHSGNSHTTLESEPSQGRTAQFQNLLHGLSDISRPRSADVVPMAKRLLESVKSRGAAAFPQQGYPHTGDSGSGSVATPSSASSSISGFSAPQSVSKTEPSSPTAAMSIPKVEQLQRRRSSSRHPALSSTMGSDDDDDDIFYDPLMEQTTESIMNPFEKQRRAQSLTESFVALKYSSSADSQSGVLVNDLDQSTVSTRGPDSRVIADETMSEGGLMPLKDLKLLQTGAPLMIPKLQEPGYMTEDMIQQQEELFETLGSSSDAAKMRAKMQSMQLISDMEAFKAANPGCVLGDFIRWHSPKDWVEDKGEMSARMADAGNFWQELWAHSKRIPVCRQAPLFNHNQEAAKVLFYLDGISPSQLFVHLLPTMCLLAYDTLVSHPISSHIRQVAQGLKELASDMVGFPWNELTGDQDLSLDSILDNFRKVELLMGRAIALVRKFPGQYDLVQRILQDQEAVVEDGSERECVYDLFSIGGSLQSSFPQATSREFILETFDPTEPAVASWSSSSTRPAEPTGFSARPLQRRMYACFKESEVRIVEAIAKDGLYM